MNKEQLNQLKEKDVSSLLLFALYKLKDTDEYSTLSELAYILDRKHLLRLIDIFGGLTIRIPTREEFILLLDSLLLYCYVNIENIEYSKAVKMLNLNDVSIKDIKDSYLNICKVLNDYEFNRG